MSSISKRVGFYAFFCGSAVQSACTCPLSPGRTRANAIAMMPLCMLDFRVHLVKHHAAFVHYFLHVSHQPTHLHCPTPTLVRFLQATPHTQIRELWGEGGDATTQAFEALAVKLFARLPAGVTFGMRSCDVKAGAAGWASLASSASSLRSFTLDRVPCSPHSVAGLAAFLRGASEVLASVTCTGCSMTGEMLQAVVGSLPAKPAVVDLDLSCNALTMLPEQLPRVMSSLTVRSAAL